jgi:hypothetical protein
LGAGGGVHGIGAHESFHGVEVLQGPDEQRIPVSYRQLRSALSRILRTQ